MCPEKLHFHTYYTSNFSLFILNFVPFLFNFSIFIWQNIFQSFSKLNILFHLWFILIIQLHLRGIPLQDFITYLMQWYKVNLPWSIFPIAFVGSLTPGPPPLSPSSSGNKLHMANVGPTLAHHSQRLSLDGLMELVAWEHPTGVPYHSLSTNSVQGPFSINASARS